MFAPSTVAFAVGMVCVVAGLATVLRPQSVARVSERVLPAADDQQWSAVGWFTAAVGFLLVATA